ncbi:hypothetical protein S83_069481 [Arachis hypogaea]
MADADAKRITTTATVRDTLMLWSRRGQVKIRIFKSIMRTLSCATRSRKTAEKAATTIFLLLIVLYIHNPAGSEWLPFR